MNDQTAVVAILENDVPLSYPFDLLAKAIKKKCPGVPIALVKNYMLLAKSDHHTLSDLELYKTVREQVTGWLKEPGLCELLSATANNSEDLRERLMQCEGHDKTVLMLVFRDFLTIDEIADCMGWGREMLVERMQAIAKHLNGKTRA